MLNTLEKFGEEIFRAEGRRHGVINVDIVNFPIKIVGDSRMEGWVKVVRELL